MNDYLDELNDSNYDVDEIDDIIHSLGATTDIDSSLSYDTWVS